MIDFLIGTYCFVSLSAFIAGMAMGRYEYFKEKDPDGATIGFLIALSCPVWPLTLVVLILALCHDATPWSDIGRANKEIRKTEKRIELNALRNKLALIEERELKQLTKYGGDD